MSLNTTISLYNQMTPVLKSVVNSMNMVISSAYDVGNATDEMLSTSSLDAANKYIQEAGAGITELEGNLIQASQQQENYNKKAKEGQSAIDGIVGKAKMLVTTYLGMKGVSMFTDTADSFSLMQSRLDRVNDGTRTTAELQKEVYLLAQRTRNEYGNTLDIYTKLGTQAKGAFKTNNELLAFTEQLNKNLILAGTDAQGVQSVMYNLTQAMASGVLRGQDLNAVMSNAMPIVDKIADYLGVSVGEIRELAAEGEIASSVVKEALLAAAEETNAEFAKMPYTLGQAMTMVKNSFLQGLMPAFETFSEFINSDNFEQFTINVMNFGNTVAEVINNVVSGFITGFNFIYDNSEILIPIFTEIIGLLILWKAYAFLINEEHKKMMMGFIKNPYVLAIAGAIAFVYILSEVYQSLGMAKDGTEGLEMALNGLAKVIAGLSFLALAAHVALSTLNVTLLSNPIGWIIALVGALIFLIYRWIQSVGGIQIAWKIAINAILTKGEEFHLWLVKSNHSVNTWRENMILSAIELKNGFLFHVGEMRIGVAKLLDKMINEGIEQINKFITVLNELPFVELDTIQKVSFEAETKAYEEGLRQQRDKNFSEKELEYQISQSSRESYINDLYEKQLAKQTARQNEIKQLQAEVEANKNQEQPDYNSMFGTNSDIYGALNDIAGNTKDISGKLDWENDDLSSLKDLMEQRAITDLSKEVKLEVHNEFTGAIGSDVDSDRLASIVSENIRSELEIAINAG